MDNDENNMNNGEGDYGQEDPNYEGGDNAGAAEADGEVDQYFDDAGDIGYLPADHVTAN